ncbi:M13 family metallopeptidase [Sphingomonas sanguinis]|jgi:putative endopeptidase|uniref:M13 family metallopeptidase n=1 Tax=Sphingomonas sanguinis TaxID=33051 RepID=A0A7Y7USG5_9SPHN|nr:M13 family metallopeptidase [Sphingomonas sanguinis]MBZ6382413.1 M13 family metallopeptidase [Sphingomonas sanguinis]NNG50604.1 M13 family metallopeptidase [Sphingomonas sanguinis]NNG54682.1 M13 family metallopeptidase [Sphingomonas sanguinis]NVP31711.1 M13 family metallopeptidase [Sphingomonas sanguinis]
MKRFAFAAALLVTTAAIAQTGSLPGVDKAYMDPSVKPGDNFDTYANGGWRKTAEIPADRSSIGVGLDVSLRAEARTAAIIKGAAATRGAPGSDQQRIADYYAAYTDTNGIEARGLTPIQASLSAIAAIKNKSDLSRAIGAAMRSDTDPFNNNNYASTNDLFGLFVSQDLNQPTRNVPYLMQGGLGLPDRDYYLSDKPEMAEIRTAYQAYLTQLMQLAGLSDPQGRAARVFALETKIAAAQTDIIASQDAHKGDNPWTRADFDARAPGLDWTAFWTAAGLPAGQRDFIAWQPDAITKLSALVASEPLQSWQDWLAFHTINQVTSVLPKAIDDASFGFYGRTLTGTPAQQPREKRGIAAVNGALGEAVGKIYAQRYFPASSKTEIQTMVKNIVGAFDRRVAALDWMAPATKAEARRKLAVLKVGVGYPDHWWNYPKFAVRADDPVGNAQRARLAMYRYHLGKLGKPVDRSEWWMTPQTVNAVNLPLQNALNFPAAILESPYFDPKFDAAANYGAIGSVIGHEISHSFDNLGADFDSTGRLHNWWTPADLKRFEEAGQALVAQYSAYEALPGLHLNGEQELGENIADVAGLTAAYEAYKASLGGKPAPVIDGLTGDQRFFLAFAQGWRSKMRDRALRARIATDVHAPAPWRVLTVRNLDAWYAPFHVQPGQALYLPPEKRVHVW